MPYSCTLSGRLPAGHRDGPTESVMFCSVLGPCSAALHLFAKGKRADKVRPSYDGLWPAAVVLDIYGSRPLV